MNIDAQILIDTQKIDTHGWLIPILYDYMFMSLIIDNYVASSRTVFLDLFCAMPHILIKKIMPPIDLKKTYFQFTILGKNRINVLIYKFCFIVAFSNCAPKYSNCPPVGRAPHIKNHCSRRYQSP